MKFGDLVILIESKDSRRIKTGEFFYYAGDDVPSIVQANNVVYVDENNLLHRKDGPAIVTKFSWGGTSKSWFKHGKRHRLDGPSVVITQGINGDSERYYINGIEYSKEEFDEYIKNMNKEELDMLGDLGQSFE